MPLSEVAPVGAAGSTRSVEQDLVDEQGLLLGVEGTNVIGVAVYRLPVGGDRGAFGIVAEIVHRIDDRRPRAGGARLETLDHRFLELGKFAPGDVRYPLHLPSGVEPVREHRGR